MLFYVYMSYVTKPHIIKSSPNFSSQFCRIHHSNLPCTTRHCVACEGMYQVSRFLDLLIINLQLEYTAECTSERKNTITNYHARGLFKIKSCHYRNSHCEEKTVLWPAYLHDRISILVRQHPYIESGWWLPIRVMVPHTANYSSILMIFFNGFSTVVLLSQTVIKCTILNGSIIRFNCEKNNLVPWSSL